MRPLIQPVRQGPELLQEIAETQLDAGSLAVWWLGQSGFLIKSRFGMTIIDPYLSDHLTTKYAQTSRPHVRMMAAPLGGQDLRAIDLILVTHRHSDHLDPATIPDLMSASPEALLVLPEAIIDHALALGLPGERLLGLNAGQGCRRAWFLIRAVPAAHETLETDAGGRYLHLGYVIEVDGLRLYHSGDSLAYDTLIRWLGPQPFDVAFLPINGRDPARGVPGNMSAAEAVDLAARLRPRFVVPHHYDMFTFNTVPVMEFEVEARRLPPDVAPRVLQCGERWEVHRGDANATV
jgi:L-ascorbate metabolism protein UlaG (beta-lactamase superfamily)